MVRVHRVAGSVRLDPGYTTPRDSALSPAVTTERRQTRRSPVRTLAGFRGGRFGLWLRIAYRWPRSGCRGARAWSKWHSRRLRCIARVARLIMSGMTMAATSICAFVAAAARRSPSARHLKSRAESGTMVRSPLKKSAKRPRHRQRRPRTHPRGRNKPPLHHRRLQRYHSLLHALTLTLRRHLVVGPMFADFTDHLRES